MTTLSDMVTVSIFLSLVPSDVFLLGGGGGVPFEISLDFNHCSLNIFFLGGSMGES